MRIGTVGLWFMCAMPAGAQTISTPFEPELTDTLYLLNTSNWCDCAEVSVTAHSGPLALLSANGNADITLDSLGVWKDLGGPMEDTVYDVSFWIATYYDELHGVSIGDFHDLYIGGPEGEMTWDSVPQPTVPGEWIKWHGTYRPAADEVGQSMAFKAFFDLAPLHAIALDGPVEARISTETVLAVTASLPPIGIRVDLQGGTPSILIPDGLRATQILVVDASGRMVVNRPVVPGKCRLALEALPCGAYTCLLRDISGSVIARERFVLAQPGR